MTDPKPYTPEELDQLDLPGEGELQTDASWDTLDLARVRATVQALAEAERHVRALLENADPRPIQQSIQEQAAMAWLAAREDL